MSVRNEREKKTVFIANATRFFYFVLIFCASMPAFSAAKDTVSDFAREDELGVGSETSASGWSFLLSPATELYPRPVADPHRPGFSITYRNYSRTEIADAGKNRLGIRLGGSYGLVRVHPTAEPRRGYQLDIGGNFLGLFDLDHGLDNIGWDGLYHLALTGGDGEGFAFKLGTSHDSSHVGDEYAERTGRRRVGYTREEVVLGVSKEFSRLWRAYVEAGRAYHRSNKAIMEPWRGQLGLEYETQRRGADGGTAWYAAVDGTFYQENDWHGNATIQIGIVIPQNEIGRQYRFGVEYYRGRSILGEFFQNHETSYSLGFWWDL